MQIKVFAATSQGMSISTLTLEAIVPVGCCRNPTYFEVKNALRKELGPILNATHIWFEDELTSPLDPYFGPYPCYGLGARGFIVPNLEILQ